MRRVQTHAVRLFDEQGFDAVTVEAIAEAACVSPVSVYRWFGTKHGVVLWDAYDPDLLGAMDVALRERPPLDAARHAVVTELGRVYDRDRDLVLARTQLIHREPSLLAATWDELRQLQRAIGGRFAAAAVGEDDLARAVLAGAAVSVLVAAVDAWQAADGRVPLAEIVDRGFLTLEPR